MTNEKTQVPNKERTLKDVLNILASWINRFVKLENMRVEALIQG